VITVLERAKKYFKEINEMEKLGKRSIKEWEEVGTKEEAIKVFKFQKRKERNKNIANMINLGLYGGIILYAYIDEFKKTKKQQVKEQKVVELAEYKKVNE
jgi:hypothetical protein